jgi:putative restriction endonuclease
MLQPYDRGHQGWQPAPQDLTVKRFDRISRLRLRWHRLRAPQVVATWNRRIGDGVDKIALHTAVVSSIKTKKKLMNEATKEHWLAKLAKLRVDLRGNPAPHKPLLLLVVIELAEQGLLSKGTVPLTPELAFRFCTYWTIVAHRRTQKPDVRFPFHHMQSGGFWTALAEDGSPSPHRSLTRYAALDQDFEECLGDRAFREEARRVLLCKYFPPDERVALCALLELPVPSDDEAAGALMHKSPEEAEQKGREARFRLKVVSLYNYTCALTGYRLMTIASGSIVDAAHIHQFSDSRNNDVRNGIALCKNAHWLFDEGLWTIADDYTVRVALGHFAEDSPDQRPLSDYHGQRIRLPIASSLYPDPAHLDWHRREKFVGRD